MKLVPVILFIFLFTNTIGAQNITGVITDKSDRQPVVGAIVFRSLPGIDSGLL